LKAGGAADIILGSIDIVEGSMVRTLISLAEGDKRWLDQRARALGVPMTAVMRQAVAALREQEARRASFDRALKETAGIWKAGDGLAWQRKLRAEWK
jgi:hypothetical protein